MSQSIPRTPYAKDEDLALRVGPDFRILCPADQVVAAGVDGAFAPANPWTLTSASTDFVSRGVVAGQVVQLTKPVSAFAAPGTFLTIESVAAGGLTLRRKGRPAGSGQPPSGPSGLASVEFLIASFAPQLERASAEIDRRLGLDPTSPARVPTEPSDLDALRDAAVLLVLAQAFEALDHAGDASSASKARAIRIELDDALARLATRWGVAGPGNRLGTRLTR